MPVTLAPPFLQLPWLQPVWTDATPPATASGLAIDPSTPPSVSSATAGTVTTASFTPPAGSMLVACIGANNPGAGQTHTFTVSGGSLSWALVKQSSNGVNAGIDGAAALYVAFVGSSAPMTVTCADSNGTGTGKDLNLKVLVFTGAEASYTGVSTAGHAASGSPSATLNVTAGSAIVAVASDWSAVSAATAGANTTLVDDYVNAGQVDVHTFRSTSLALSAGNNTVSVTPSTEQYNVVALEVKLPAGGGGTAASGTATLTLDSTSSAAAPVTSTGAITLGATGTAAAAAAATGALTLTAAGTASAAATTSGTLTLAGTATPSTTATGSLTLSAASTAQAPTTGTAAVVLTGTSTATASPAGTGSLTLTATGTAAARTTATAALTLTGLATALAPITGTAQVTLSGTLNNNGTPATGTAALTLQATGTARAPITTTGSLTLAGTATGAARASTTALINMAAALTARVQAAATGVLNLLGVATSSAPTAVGYSTADVTAQTTAAGSTTQPNGSSSVDYAATTSTGRTWA